MSGRLLAAAGALAALASACGAAPEKASGAPAATPTAAAAASTSSSTAAGPRAEMPSGAVYKLELALTPEEQAQGLMYRENVPDRTGMIFVFDQAADHHFWMKNTMVPLDMIWMDAAGKVIFVSANTPPCGADPCATYGPDAPARLVLEIAGGMAAKEKITAGSTLRLLDVPQKP